MPYPRFTFALLVCALPFLAWSENGPDFPIGSVIQNFALPQADASGKKTALVRGKRATVVSPNQLKIEELDVDLYNAEGKSETTITATRCDFWRKENRLTTDTGILVKKPTLMVSANGMDWNVADSCGTLYTRVRVVLTSANP